MKKSSQGPAEEVIRFYEIEQAKLLLDFEKVALFTKHPTSLGQFRESRLRQYLRDFTPSRLTVGTGFVSTWNQGSGKISDDQSKQIDCLVFDSQTFSPLLHTDDYSIIFPEAFYAAIEVKSSLTFHRESSGTKTRSEKYPLGGGHQESYRWSGTMIEALANIASLTHTIKGRTQGTFHGVFAYSMTFDWNLLYYAFDNNEIQTQLGITHIDELPVAICVPGSLIIHLSPYDMFETAPHHDEASSFFNVIQTTETHPAYPLQFFSTFYTNQINHKLETKKPDKGRLFSAIGSKVAIWSHHFDLNSEGYEDQ
ncbi:DUF6602 domain-containing protein [Bradyrhizobium glycinis]|uniref:DUF6602 domain-containing protein n=1 Tax=Bradyrhizobium glycinis TaxID=2751812 RepID=UPI0018D7FF7E|nr:DUF6602 domain-containing protein [Bradyrhizobium glycinis]MBH5371008.1 hypothetical protein [Bradyrhizobium glycinis]